MLSLLQHINQETQVVPFLNARYLEVRKKYKIKSIALNNSQYGKQVLVECEDFKIPLPQRFLEKFSQDIVEKLNKEIQIGNVIYIISNGAVNQTTNLHFEYEVARV